MQSLFKTLSKKFPRLSVAQSDTRASKAQWSVCNGRAHLNTAAANSVSSTFM
jgi:hypothetical protein